MWRAVAVAAGFVMPGLAPAQDDPVSDDATAPDVEAMLLDAPNPGAAGLLQPRVTGLPASLWRGSDPATIRALIKATDPAVPALQHLMRTLMLAEADPPGFGPDGVAHLAARIDWLVARGAVDEAEALLQIGGLETPELFARWASLRLLLGDVSRPCAALTNRPTLSSDMSLRIFCAARDGDWNRAALVLRTSQALGQISPRRADLLTRFLDPEIAEETTLPPPPVRPSPLEFRLYEALGEPLPTAPLPVAFAVLDLKGDNGWRAQIEAAERLARNGSLSANRLLGLYTLRRPAASGGVWDRAAAIQALERALERGTPDVVGAALLKVWPQMANSGLLRPFAELFAEPLSEVALDGRAARLQRLTIALSSGYEILGPEADSEARFLASIARGETPAAASLPHAAAIAQGFAASAPPDVLQTQLDQGRLGEVILRSVALFSSGADGNSDDLSDALATLRSIGLEDAARRAALELTVLDVMRARR